MHVECGKASESGVDVTLCCLFPFVVVLFVEWEWGVVGDVVPDVVFCKSYGAHVGFVVVECGAEVGVVPLDVFGCSTDVLGVVEGFLQFFRHACELEPALGVVFPDGGPQHRCLGVCVEISCFHRRV